jgi:hypothetical protein
VQRLVVPSIRSLLFDRQTTRITTITRAYAQAVARLPAAKRRSLSRLHCSLMPSVFHLMEWTECLLIITSCTDLLALTST